MYIYLYIIYVAAFLIGSFLCYKYYPTLKGKYIDSLIVGNGATAFFFYIVIDMILPQLSNIFPRVYPDIPTIIGMVIGFITGGFSGRSVKKLKTKK